jgi:hypothetical protein
VVIEMAGHRVVVEYDSLYHHSRRHDVDLAKSAVLARAGYVVIRVREGDLPMVAHVHEVRTCKGEFATIMRQVQRGKREVNGGGRRVALEVVDTLERALAMKVPPSSRPLPSVTEVARRAHRLFEEAKERARADRARRNV